MDGEDDVFDKNSLDDEMGEEEFEEREEDRY